MSWLPLRDHLAALIDRRIADERDPEARALIAYHRDRVIDQLELQMLRRIIAERDQGKPCKPEAPPKLIKLNGRHAIKVAAR